MFFCCHLIVYNLYTQSTRYFHHQSINYMDINTFTVCFCFLNKFDYPVYLTSVECVSRPMRCSSGKRSHPGGCLIKTVKFHKCSEKPSRLLRLKSSHWETLEQHPRSDPTVAGVGKNVAGQMNPFFVLQASVMTLKGCSGSNQSLTVITGGMNLIYIYSICICLFASKNNTEKTFTEQTESAN